MNTPPDVVIISPLPLSADFHYFQDPRIINTERSQEKNQDVFLNSMLKLYWSPKYIFKLHSWDPVAVISTLIVASTSTSCASFFFKFCESAFHSLLTWQSNHFFFFFTIQSFSSASSLVLLISLYSFSSVSHTKVPKSDISMSRHTAVIWSNTFQRLSNPPKHAVSPNLPTAVWSHCCKRAGCPSQRPRRVICGSVGRRIDRSSCLLACLNGKSRLSPVWDGW